MVIRNKLLYDFIFMKFLFENIVNMLKILICFIVFNLFYFVEVCVVSYLFLILIDSNGNMYKGDLDVILVMSIVDFIGVSYRYVIWVL